MDAQSDFDKKFETKKLLNDLDAQSDFDKKLSKKAGQVEPYARGQKSSKCQASHAKEKGTQFWNANIFTMYAGCQTANSVLQAWKINAASSWNLSFLMKQNLWHKEDIYYISLMLQYLLNKMVNAL